MAWIERKLEQIAWDKAGRTVEGHLLRIETVKYADGAGLRYNVRRKDGTVVIFPGATLLNAKLGPADIGYLVSVKYEGEDATRDAQHGRSRPKLFQVLVDDTEKLRVGYTATDEDIPF